MQMQTADRRDDELANERAALEQEIEELPGATAELRLAALGMVQVNTEAGGNKQLAGASGIG